VHAGQTIGWVRVYGNSDGILRYALSGAIIALACLGLTVGATRILASRLDHAIIGSLDGLARASRHLRSTRDFSARLPAIEVPEIDSLTSDYNALLAEIERRSLAPAAPGIANQPQPDSARGANEGTSHA
jgi:diguanylate cyclase